jgi:DNA-binding MarR family transcriptional regulator
MGNLCWQQRNGLRESGMRIWRRQKRPQKPQKRFLRLGRSQIAPALEKRILEALATRGRPGIRVIAERFGVNPSTVQRISRPFDGASVAVA